MYIIYAAFGLSWLQKGEYTMVQVEVGGMVSEPKSLISTSGDNWVPFLTIIVDLDDGRLKSVGWDDGCFTCDSSDTNVCIDDNCGVAYDKCFNNSATDNTGKSQDCDLKIYIGWTGIGSDGNYLTSAGTYAWVYICVTVMSGSIFMRYVLRVCLLLMFLYLLACVCVRQKYHLLCMPALYQRRIYASTDLSVSFIVTTAQLAYPMYSADSYLLICTLSLTICSVFSTAKKFSSFTKYSVGSAWSSASANAGGNPSPGAGDS